MLQFLSGILSMAERGFQIRSLSFQQVIHNAEMLTRVIFIDYSDSNIVQESFELYKSLPMLIISKKAMSGNLLFAFLK